MADEPLKETAGDDWAAALGEQGAGPQTPGFEELGEGTTSQAGSQNLDFLLDVPLEVSVELGKTTMIINRILQLTQGSVVELSKAAGEPVEIFVNRKLMGKGEVTEIISQADRIKNMA